MRAMRDLLRRLPEAAVFLLSSFLAVPAICQTADLEHIRDQYQGKPLVLRSFYSGDSLRYDSSGSPLGESTTGDWTTDGFVRLNDISISDRHLTATGVRLIVISHENVFQFFARHSLGRHQRPPNLRIEVELSPDGTLAQSADIALSKVFLTTRDSFRDLVPDYWRYCVRDALSDSDEDCHFAKDFMPIPGFAIGERQGLWEGVPKNPPFRLGMPGFSAPQLISLDRACLTDAARKAEYRGVVDFQVVIDGEGHPSNVRIISPIGFGLDARAAHALENSRWKPAEIDGKPITMVLTTEIDCIK